MIVGRATKELTSADILYEHTMSLIMVAMVFVMITMSLASANVFEILNEESTLKNPENPDYNIENGSIDFENVSSANTMKNRYQQY